MNAQQDHEDHELAAKKIAALLDQGARELESVTAAKLLEARKEALAHYRERPAHAWVPEWATSTIGRITRPFGNNLALSVLLLAFLVSLTGVVAWQTFGQQASEIAEIDAALLTDELPINAYLDKGFDSWLKRP